MTGSFLLVGVLPVRRLRAAAAVGQLPQFSTPTRGNEVFAMNTNPLPKRAWPAPVTSPPHSGHRAANRSWATGAPAFGAIS
jgi:hypothetical protein